MKIKDPRVAAFEILSATILKKHRFDDALAALNELSGMESRDRALARLLAMTVLRRTAEIDAIIKPLLRKRLRGRAAPVQNLLRIGVAQLIFLETPPHAAVTTTVNAASATGNRAYKGLVNAVLRRITREGVTRATDPGRQNTPDWLWESWARAYGAETARAIANAHLQEPPLDITVKSSPESWCEQLDADLLPTGTLRRTAGGDVRTLPGFDDGAWWIQDAAAALPAKLVGDPSGKTVFDLCAAPGGKTAQLAAAGGTVLAVDENATRLKRLAENLDRLGLSADLIEADVAQWTPPQKADAVLLDAPCTATGTIRRHPDIAHLKSPDEVKRLAGLQSTLLNRAADMVKPGGVLVYATCSLQPEEGPDRIDSFLSSGAPYIRHPIDADELPGLESAITAAGEVRTLPSHWPEKGGLDGFFIARLRRN